VIWRVTAWKGSRIFDWDLGGCFGIGILVERIILGFMSCFSKRSQGVAAWMVGTSLYHNSGEDMIFLGQMANGPS